MFEFQQHDPNKDVNPKLSHFLMSSPLPYWKKMQLPNLTIIYTDFEANLWVREEKNR